MILSREIYEDLLESLMAGRKSWTPPFYDSPWSKAVGLYDRAGMEELLEKHDAAVRDQLHDAQSLLALVDDMDGYVSHWKGRRTCIICERQFPSDDGQGCCENRERIERHIAAFRAAEKAKT